MVILFPLWLLGVLRVFFQWFCLWGLCRECRVIPQARVFPGREWVLSFSVCLFAMPFTVEKQSFENDENMELAIVTWFSKPVPFGWFLACLWETEMVRLESPQTPDNWVELVLCTGWLCINCSPLALCKAYLFSQLFKINQWYHKRGGERKRQK